MVMGFFLNFTKLISRDKSVYEKERERERDNKLECIL